MMINEAIKCASKACTNKVEGVENYYCTKCSRAKYYPVWQRQMGYVLTNMAGCSILDIGKESYNEITP